jgi:hypothetical protein
MQNPTDKTPDGNGNLTDQDRETALLSRDSLQESYSRTTRIDGQPEVIPLPYWGNTFLGRAARLQLEVEGFSEMPIEAHIQDRLVIGRTVPDAPDRADIDLTPYGGQYHGVSRRHVMIIKEGNLLKVADLGSTNGTYLNGVRLQPRQPRLLRTGDQLSLGQLIVKVSSLI